MLGEVVGQEELGGSLNIGGGEGSLVVVSDQLGGLESELLEHIQNQGVDNLHSLLRDSNVVGDALEDLVDVQGEGLEVLLVSSDGGLFGHSYYILNSPYIYLKSDLTRYWMLLVLGV